MINRVTLIGRMTRDPELRRMQNGMAVASFTLALNRNFTNQNGERQADFIPCVIWSKAAENVAKYCAKGSLVGIDGQLQSRQYVNKNNQKVFVVEVLCNSVQFLDTRNKPNQATEPQNATSPYNYMDYQQSSSQASFGSLDDIPFSDDDIQF